MGAELICGCGLIDSVVGYNGLLWVEAVGCQSPFGERTLSGGYGLIDSVVGCGFVVAHREKKKEL